MEITITVSSAVKKNLDRIIEVDTEDRKPKSDAIMVAQVVRKATDVYLQIRSLSFKDQHLIAGIIQAGLIKRGK